MKRQSLVSPSVALCLAASACVPTPPATAPTREPLPITASFGRTWEAVIDQFARRSIPIATIDRASGIIVSGQLATSYADRQLADCGRDGLGTPGLLRSASYNVLVRGDSTQSTVLVTARFAGVWSSNIAVECTTTGVFEPGIEMAVKTSAEAKRP